MRSRLLRWFSDTRGAARLAALALVLSLPSVALPPVLDDHGVRARLDVQRLGADEAFHLRDGSERRLTGRSPWWAGPGKQLRFFRPLSGLTHVIDFRLWPGATGWMRLQNCLWYALLVWLVARCYRRLQHRGQPLHSPATGPAWAMAALMFAVNDAHAQSLTFIVGRNTLLWALFGVASVLAHHAQRESPSLVRAAAGPLAFGCALLAGEGGLTALGYIVAYAACLDDRPLGARARSLVPYGAALVAWAGCYVAGGYGTRGYGLYRDLLGQPLTTLGAGLADLPIWIATQLTLGFAGAASPLEPAVVRTAALPVALLMLLCLWPTLRDDRLARFYGLGFALSLVPLFASWPQDRLLVMASFGAFGLLACFFERTSSAATGRGRRFARGALLVVHLGIAPLAFIPSYLVARPIARAEERVDAALPRGSSAAHTGIVIIRAPTALTLGYALERREARGEPLPAYDYELYSASGEVSVHRVDARTLELVPAKGYCTTRIDCGSYDLRKRFARGRTLSLAAMQVEIVDVDARGAPRRVRFRFPSQLEDPSRRWVTWTDRGIERFTLPAIGQTVTLPAISPLAAFR